MKLQTLYEDAVNGAEFNLITEAVRFGSEQKKILQQFQRFITIGIEYEFHLNSDVVGFDAELDQEELRDVAEQRLGDKMRPQLKPLANFLFEMSMVWYDDDHLEGMLDDAEKGDMDEYNELRKFLLSPQTLADIRNIIDSDVVREALDEVRDDLIEIAKALPAVKTGVTEGIRALRNMRVSDLYELSRKTDEQTAIRTMGSLYNLISSGESPAAPEWYMEELMAEMDNERANPSAGYSTANIDDYVEWVQENISDKVKPLISEITTDMSVDEGVEVISKPLNLQDTMVLMAYMFDFIQENGHTSKQTGMHINLSFKHMDNLDPLKLMTLIDSDFWQNNTNANRVRHNQLFKYDPRNHMVEPNTDDISQLKLERIADAYLERGVVGMENELRDVIMGGSRGDKYKAINWQNFLRPPSAKEKRIEFRFFGGDGYEERLEEIGKDIMFLSYAIIAVSNKAHTQDHLKGMIRILDRASKRAFNYDFGTLVNKRRKGETE